MINAALDIHHDDSAFGHRLIADALAAGHLDDVLLAEHVVVGAGHVDDG